MEFLYIVLTLALSIGAAFLFRYLENKGLLKSQDLLLVMQMYGLGTAIVKELRLQKEAEILKISQIAYNTVEYVYIVSQELEDNKLIKVTNEYIEKQFILLELELTDNRKIIVDELIKIGVDNKLLQMNVLE